MRPPCSCLPPMQLHVSWMPVFKTNMGQSCRRTPLTIACHRRQVDLVVLAMQNGARDTKNDVDALHQVLIRSNDHARRAVLNRSALTSSFRRQHLTAAHAASSKKVQAAAEEGERIARATGRRIMPEALEAESPPAPSAAAPTEKGPRTRKQVASSGISMLGALLNRGSRPPRAARPRTVSAPMASAWDADVAPGFPSTPSRRRGQRKADSSNTGWLADEGSSKQGDGRSKSQPFRPPMPQSSQHAPEDAQCDTCSKPPLENAAPGSWTAAGPSPRAAARPRGRGRPATLRGPPPNSRPWGEAATGKAASGSDADESPSRGGRRNSVQLRRPRGWQPSVAAGFELGGASAGVVDSLRQGTGRA